MAFLLETATEGTHFPPEAFAVGIPVLLGLLAALMIVIGFGSRRPHATSK